MYDVTSNASAKVNIKPNVGTKTITQNGTYNANDDDLDGYSQVKVETGGIDEYFSDTIEAGTRSSEGGWIKTLLKFKSPLTIKGTSVKYMFSGYPLSEIPEIDITNVTDMSNMFYSYENLIVAPQLNTSNVTNMGSTFYGCIKLKSIPQYDTSKVINMEGTFRGCNSLAIIPQLDTSKVTNMSRMLFMSSNANFVLTAIPQFNTSNVTDMGTIFYNCRGLITIPQLNASKIINIASAFSYCNSLENFGGLLNIGQSYSTTASANYSDYRIDLSSCSKLPHDSIMNVINGLYDIASAGIQSQQLILGPANLIKLADEEIAIATNKGWTVS